ncbi:DUF58 domain-containing protein [Microbacterium sp. Marseille-Q6965]|uniref:DUF58 domain-containing protein n=1 Tax=Microbacterium sp. Marseille-Q6965 TaxID=2965072 RepID=UPI0021B77D27|nr:DUF58 domain-containing protein [Microbacterium sp. Marseille-Q6965]
MSSRRGSRQGPPLTARGWAVLALGVACLPLAAATGAAAAQYVGVALLSLLAVCWFAARHARPGVEVARRLSEESVEVGSETTIELRLSAEPPRRPPRGQWRDALPPGLSGDASGTVPRGDGSEVRVSYTVTGMRRGRHPVGPLELAATDPFGLWRRTALLGEPTPVLVVPRARWLAPLPRAHGDVGDGGESEERRGRGSDNLIPRPYAPGDSMRRIHWRASAHRGSFMVRDEEEQTVPAATVVLDLASPRWPAEARAGEDAGFEAAVTACVSAAWRLASDGFAVTVTDHAGRALADVAAPDGSALESLERAFATVVPDRSDLGRSGEGAGFTLPASTGPLVVVCGTVDDRLAPALDPLARHSWLPVLLTPSPLRSSLERLSDGGWAVARLGEDVAAAWLTAFDRVGAGPGGAHGDR